MSNTNTGGGGYVTGNVDTEGGGFTGRDAPAQQVNLQFGDRTPKEIAEILRRLQVTTFGDVEAGIRGLVREIEALRQEVKDVRQEVAAIKEEIATRQEANRVMQLLLYFISTALIILLGVAVWPILF